MNIKLFLLLLTFLAIVPNLGFFTLPAFFTISFIVFILILIIFFSDNKDISSIIKSQEINPLYLFALLFFSAFYYGGLYQNEQSIIIGNFIFFGLIFFVFINQYIFKKSKYVLTIIILTYLSLSLWTIINSPKPIVDTIVVFKEAPLKFIQGINPYNSAYTRTYPDIEPNYYNYLPFSFIYMLPFVLIFGDPRIGIIAANIGSVYILVRLFSKYNDKLTLNLIIFTFLFLPRSFYMLEHVYMDPIIFFFFLLSTYLLISKKISKSLFLLSLFFSFRQTLFLLLPFFLSKKIAKFLTLKNLIIFFIPFLLPLYFLLIDPKSFLGNTLFNLSSKNISSPITFSLTLPTFLTNFILHNHSQSYIVGYLFLAVSYILLLIKKTPLITRIIAALFFMNFGLYHAFFNSYYFIAQFLLLSIMFDYFGKNNKYYKEFT